MKNFKLILLILVVLSEACLLSACHTVRGVGEDIQAGGKAISQVGK